MDCYIRIYGQASNATTRRLAAMNLALYGIKADFGPEHADTVRRDLHPELRADTATRVSANPKPRSHLAGFLRSERQLLANPPFNDSDTALCDSAFLQAGGKQQVISERCDNFRKDDDDRCYGAAADKEKPTVSQYSKRLVDALPYLRNALAHGSSEQHEAAADSVHICGELINQLFPELPPPPGIAGATG